MLKALVIASGNKGKIAEIRAALAGADIALKTQGELNIEGAPEPHGAFLENALAKARHAARLSGMPALSDDSGIVVPALGGAPGVHSARYSQGDDDGDNSGDDTTTTDERNNEKLLAAMRDVKDRRAFYYAAMVLTLSEDDPAPVFAEGYWHGEIAHAPAGAGGFGYDPLFYCAKVGATGGEMTPAQKMRVSHRGQSLRRLARLLRLRRLI